MVPRPIAERGSDPEVELDVPRAQARRASARPGVGVLTGIAALALLAARAAGAEPARPNVVYVEALGKGGVWGAGYERTLSSRLGIGLVASYFVLDGSQQLVSVVPYGAVRILGRHHHRWFADAGPEYVYLRTPSPVPEWTGTTASGFGGQLSTGYEYRGRVLVRVYAELVAGTRHGHDFAPWGGASFGWTF